MTKQWKILLSVVSVASSLAAHAGPVIIDGTDANDHGSAVGGANLSGWLYMQRALENLAATVSGTAAKVVVDLGTTSGQARNAINSAFSLSSLATSGWTLQHVDTAASIGTYLGTLSTTNTGILYIPTYGNSSGDLDSLEMAAINAQSASINSFVGGAGNPLLGGGLFSMGQTGAGAYGWLTTLIPGITFTDVGGGGIGTNITLTAAGSAAFGGGLTNTDMAGADPWHGYFGGSLGGLSVLGIANDRQGVSRNLILGGGAGTVIGCGQPGQQPCNNVPEPDTLPLVTLAGLALILSSLRKRRIQ